MDFTVQYMLYICFAIYDVCCNRAYVYHTNLYLVNFQIFKIYFFKLIQI